MALFPPPPFPLPAPHHLSWVRRRVAGPLGRSLASCSSSPLSSFSSPFPSAAAAEALLASLSNSSAMAVGGPRAAERPGGGLRGGGSNSNSSRGSRGEGACCSRALSRLFLCSLPLCTLATSGDRRAHGACSPGPIETSCCWRIPTRGCFSSPKTLFSPLFSSPYRLPPYESHPAARGFGGEIGGGVLPRLEEAVLRGAHASCLSLHQLKWNEKSLLHLPAHVQRKKRAPLTPKSRATRLEYASVPPRKRIRLLKSRSGKVVAKLLNKSRRYAGV